MIRIPSDSPGRNKSETFTSYVQAMDVETLRWPEQRSRRAALRDAHLPRLLLVDPSTEPPVCADALEDWAFMTAVVSEIEARTIALRLLAEGSLEDAPTPKPPELSQDGILRVGSAWVSLPPLEARLVCAMLERPGAVVSRDRLTEAGWPEGTNDRNSLDVHIMRLRRRLGELGLVVRTVRSRGYALQV